jgi:hypothetical protein
LRGCGAARIDHEKLGAAADALQNVMEKDGMSFARV